MALIHLEQVWADSSDTLEGHKFHETVDSHKHHKRKNVRQYRSLLIASSQHGIHGKADLVEYHKKGEEWVPYPVEFKKGRGSNARGNKIQLCAQALCLEEMHGCHIPAGALFYGKTHKRQEIQFTPKLRDETLAVINEARSILESQKTPSAKYSKKCDSCSLYGICQPKLCEAASG